MRRLNTFEDELDEIRVKLYEEIKDMTAEEHVAYIHSLAVPILQEYGLKAVNRIKVDEQTKKEAIA
jgi:hypothetical protein